MYLMQYAISLPADYDMGSVRRRVETKGAATDSFVGLCLKAYLIREIGVDGSPVNTYAPFYVWSDIRGMSQFLCGGVGFGGIVSAFGRPTVRHWMGLDFKTGPANRSMPKAASIIRTNLPPDTDPASFAKQARAELANHAFGPEVHSSALAVDPATWEAVRFTLWRTGAEVGEAERYQVLHLSSPPGNEPSLSRNGA